MMISQREIVEKAVELALKGVLITPNNCNQMQLFENDKLTIVYSTPFSRAEVLPGHPTYMVSIWFGGKKVFSADYLTINDLGGKRKQLKPWIEALLKV